MGVCTGWPLSLTPKHALLSGFSAHCALFQLLEGRSQRIRDWQNTSAGTLKSCYSSAVMLQCCAAMRCCAAVLCCNAASNKRLLPRYRLLQVWNVNKYSGVVGVFNIQGSTWSRSRRQFIIHDKSPPQLSTVVMPADIPLFSTSLPPKADTSSTLRSNGQSESQSNGYRDNAAEFAVYNNITADMSVLGLQGQVAVSLAGKLPSYPVHVEDQNTIWLCICCGKLLHEKKVFHAVHSITSTTGSIVLCLVSESLTYAPGPCLFAPPLSSLLQLSRCCS